MKLCFIDDIYDVRFQEELRKYCRQNRVREDRALAHYFASWIPGDNDYEMIMKKIGEIVADE